MASNSMANSKLSMKLLIDKTNKQVLFAEASKPVVDFLFTLLSLKLGTVAKLLSNTNSTLNNVYRSVENLDEKYMLLHQNKDLLLNPISLNEFYKLFPAIDNNGKPSTKKEYVKDDVTFLVMDDLVIQPLHSAISMIFLLKRFNIKEIDVLQETVVELGVNEGIKLLKASMLLKSKMVLTDVFLRNIDI